MNLPGFRASLSAAAPPASLNQALRALWLDAKGDWDGAHDAAQADEGGAGDWVHGYLHRKEGDSGNAAYWYRRAKKPVCRTSLDEEWQAIVDRAAPRARVIWRSGGLRTDFVDRVVVRLGAARRHVGEILKYDRDLATQLHPLDRVHTYGSFSIASLACA